MGEIEITTPHGLAMTPDQLRRILFSSDPKERPKVDWERWNADENNPDRNIHDYLDDPLEADAIKSRVLEAYEGFMRASDEFNEAVKELDTAIAAARKALGSEEE